MIASAAVLGAAVLPTVKPTVAYNPEQVKNGVRVVLLRVDRTTVFSDQGFAKPDNAEIHAIPGLRLVYVIEALNDEPINNWLTISDGKVVYLNGQPLVGGTPVNLSGGGYSGKHDYRHYAWEGIRKPDVRDPKRAIVHDEWIRGLRAPNGKFDLHITTGFNDHKEEFVFESILLE